MPQAAVKADGSYLLSVTNGSLYEDMPRLRLPVLSEPMGVWRARPLRCHFMLKVRPRSPILS